MSQRAPLSFAGNRVTSLDETPGVTLLKVELTEPVEQLLPILFIFHPSSFYGGR